MTYEREWIHEKDLTSRLCKGTIEANKEEEGKFHLMMDCQLLHSTARAITIGTAWLIVAKFFPYYFQHSEVFTYC